MKKPVRRNRKKKKGPVGLFDPYWMDDLKKKYPENKTLHEILDEHEEKYKTQFDAAKLKEKKNKEKIEAQKEQNARKRQKREHSTGPMRDGPSDLWDTVDVEGIIRGRVIPLFREELEQYEKDGSVIEQLLKEMELCAFEIVKKYRESIWVPLKGNVGVHPMYIVFAAAALAFKAIGEYDYASDVLIIKQIRERFGSTIDPKKIAEAEKMILSMTDWKPCVDTQRCKTYGHLPCSGGKGEDCDCHTGGVEPIRHKSSDWDMIKQVQGGPAVRSWTEFSNSAKYLCERKQLNFDRITPETLLTSDEFELIRDNTAATV